MAHYYLQFSQVVLCTLLNNGEDRYRDDKILYRYVINVVILIAIVNVIAMTININIVTIIATVNVIVTVIISVNDSFIVAIFVHAIVIISNAITKILPSGWPQHL